MDTLLEYLHRTVEHEILLRIGLAVVLGGLVGLEREIRGRAAGLRTLIIVCLGSTLIMIVSTELAQQYFSGPGEAVVRVDPGRIAAGIVTGIGFLGAGVVLKLGDIVRGVTTAACIWFVAALGIAIGQGDYGMAILSTLVALGVLWLLHYVEVAVSSALYRKVTIRTDTDRSGAVLEKSSELLSGPGSKLMDLKVREDLASGETTLTVFIKVHQRFQAHEIVKKVRDLEGVRLVEWE
jgi:putative Mg2+ transporter-C (MgtC) family protein